MCRDDCPRCAVEQLEQAARNLDGYANDESGPYVLVRLDELRALTAALALFDRKEQEAEPTCPDCGGPFRNGKCHYGHNWPHDRKEQT